MEEKKSIQFINSDYVPLFRIPDGENIIITHTDGTKLVRPCTYIDECHTKVGGNIYHICQFAEQIEKCGANINPEMPPRLPDMCYAQLPSTGEVIQIKRNVIGYVPAPYYTTGNRDKNMRVAAQANDRIGVSMRESAAMLAGSMFGWDIPAADPKNYDCYGNVSKNTISKPKAIQNEERER